MAEDIRGRNVVAVIDFHEAIIYLTDAAPGERPEHLVATDPAGAFTKSTITPEILQARTKTTAPPTGAN